MELKIHLSMLSPACSLCLLQIRLKDADNFNNSNV